MDIYQAVQITGKLGVPLTHQGISYNIKIDSEGCEKGITAKLTDTQHIPSQLVIEEGTEIIEDWGFENVQCKNITLPSTLRIIGVDAFRYAQGFTEPLKLHNVHILNRAFSCSDVRRLELDNVVMFQGAFGICKELQDVKVVNSNIAEASFFNNKNLQCAYLEASHIEKDAFSGCGALSEVHLVGTKVIQQNAFSYCYNLKVLDLLDVTTVEDSAFLSSGLETIRYPKNGTLPEDTFSDCPNLKTIQLDANMSLPALVSINHMWGQAPLSSRQQINLWVEKQGQTSEYLTVNNIPFRYGAWSKLK